MDEQVIWERIQAHAGEEFSMLAGVPFTFSVQASAVKPDRVNRLIPRSDFVRALGLVPLSGTTSVHHLQAPSYLYAILMDQRIRQSDW